MNQIQTDILKVLEMIYMNQKSGYFYPYKKTIFNILKGNSNSINAIKYESSIYYKSHPKLKSKYFTCELDKLVPSYITEIPTQTNIKYKLTDKAFKYIAELEIDFSELLNDEFGILDMFENMDNLKVFSEEYFDKTFIKQKDVSTIHSNKNGSVYLSSINKLVDYESNDEKQFLEFLDSSNLARDIKVQSLQIDYKNKSKVRHYFPDIIIHTHEGYILVAEIKALTNMTYHPNLRKYEVLKEYCTRHSYGHAMIGYQSEYYTVEALKNRPFSKQLEKHVVDLMNRYGCYTHENYKAFKVRNPNLHPLDIHSIVLNYAYKKIKSFDTIELINYE